MKLSVSIQAHPKRREWAEDLARQLNCPIAWDIKGRTWDTRKRAIALADPDSDYHLVIQDDAILCEGLMEKATAFIERMEQEYPEEKHAFQLYHGHESGVSGDLHPSDFERGYARRKLLTWGVAICVPTEWLEAIVKWGNALAVHQDDTKIRKWLEFKKYKTIYPLPCLVDHRRMKENPTLVPSRDTDRYSPYFIDLTNS